MSRGKSFVWTEEAEQRLREMHHEGCSLNKIAIALGTHHGTAERKAKALGLLVVGEEYLLEKPIKPTNRKAEAAAYNALPCDFATAQYREMVR